ncbi:MAG: YggS family pyridoxal phosphate-dependent enzyme [Clostridia bacterium]|nr:YggS family pyridoxal phosphate-dependent enzyme [Clostridia bacterium]MDE7328315.1 YggS family pyridoxal phosphate-dependent enzyme [Clostridia bacterium]
MQFEEIDEKVAECVRKINEAKRKAGRDDEITLIGATKTQPAELIAYIQEKKLLSDVGENRVQELVEKYDAGKKLRWHLIGQLQSNKVKYIIDKVALVHSLDRESLADEIDRQALKRSLVCDCLIEVNMGNEISKGGVDREKIFDFLDYVDRKDGIRVRGLMSVMPNLSDKEELKELFIKFKEYFEKLKKVAGAKHLIDICSCGMTNDYELAIEYGGATQVRIGRALFGERHYTMIN